jgi:hypothetical protein
VRLSRSALRCSRLGARALEIRPDWQTCGACRAPFQSAGSMRKTGWSGAMRRTSSSGEFALTPLNKTPTSAFHRFR